MLHFDALLICQILQAVSVSSASSRMLSTRRRIQGEEEEEERRRLVTCGGCNWKGSQKCWGGCNGPPLHTGQPGSLAVTYPMVRVVHLPTLAPIAQSCRLDVGGCWVTCELRQVGYPKRVGQPALNTSKDAAVSGKRLDSESELGAQPEPGTIPPSGEWPSGARRPLVLIRGYWGRGNRYFCPVLIFCGGEQGGPGILKTDARCVNL